MKIKSFTAAEMEPRLHRHPSWELGARYVAAYGCMLMALGASWPSVRAPFAPILLIITLMGLPVSLWLRSNGVRYQGRPLNRLVLSSLVMGLTVTLSLAFLLTNLASFGVSASGLLQAFITFSANRSIELMLGVFLIFGVCRCLFILSDKDALLCSVSSFAVLLLLLVVQREPIIVIDFMVWAVLTAVLLALEHRRESRRSISGFVTAVVPGQDVRLSGRSLATIMAISLSGAVALSYTLAASDSSSRSAFEEFLKYVSSGLSRFSNDAPDAESGVTDEAATNLIDYRSAPPIPTRTVLWRMSARLSPEQDNAREKLAVQPGGLLLPAYWRLSTLGTYDGSSWSPIIGLSTMRTVAGQNSELENWPRAAILTPNGTRRQRPRGTQVRIQQLVIPAFLGSSFVPALPVPWLVSRKDNNNDVRVNPEGAFTLSQLEADTPVLIESVVSPWPEYSGAAARPVEDDPKLKLNALEKKSYLQLPTTLPQRVRDIARTQAGKNPNSLQKARRLAQWVQRTASYTLRPPGLPEERDAVDFFLFQSRRGFCTHFAGALTVLCRAVGIPARLVTGFANPEFDEESGSGMSVARAANAHAWTEVWIDGKGWVPLDATPAEDRGDNSPTLWGDISDRVGSVINNLWLVVQTNKTMWLTVFIATALLAALSVLAGKRIRDKQRWVSQARALFQSRFQKKSEIEYSNAGSTADAQREARDITARATIFSAWNKAQKQLARRYKPRSEWQTAHDWIDEARVALPQYDMSPLQTLVNLHRRAMYDPRFLGDEEIEATRNNVAQISWKKRVVE